MKKLIVLLFYLTRYFIKAFLTPSIDSVSELYLTSARFLRSRLRYALSKTVATWNIIDSKKWQKPQPVMVGAMLTYAASLNEGV